MSTAKRCIECLGRGIVFDYCTAATARCPRCRGTGRVATIETAANQSVGGQGAIACFFAGFLIGMVVGAAIIAMNMPEVRVFVTSLIGKPS